jgi:hypothetical protein
VTSESSFNENTPTAASDLLSDEALAELGFKIARAELNGEAGHDPLALWLGRAQRARVQAVGLRERAGLVQDYSRDVSDWHMTVWARLPRP